LAAVWFVLPGFAQTPVQTEFQKLLPSDGGELNYFGSAVAIDADVALLGTTSWDQSAYVFERHDGTWLEIVKLTEVTGQNFGSVLAVSEGTLLVGVPTDDVNTSGDGSVYTYTKVGGLWTFTQRLSPDNWGQNHYFGQGLDIDGDHAVIGAPGFNYLRGTAFVFERSDGIWEQIAMLLGSDSALSDQFGRAVSVSGDYALIGAPYNDAMGDSSGAVYAFERQPDGSWVQVQKLVAGDAVTYAAFGSALAQSGSRAVIGAPGGSSFSAYVFDRDANGLWTQAARLSASDGGTVTYFGDSVAIDGDLVIVGARSALDSDGVPSGAAYVFQHQPDGTWAEVAKLLASDGDEYDYLGCAVALSDGVVLVGARGDDDLADRSGAAYLFAVAEATPGCDPVLDTQLLNFGAIKVGDVSTLAATLTNKGDEACDLVAFVDSPSTEFALNAGSPSSFTLEAGAASDVLVDYAPTDIGEDTGLLGLVVSDPSGQIDVALVGSGTDAVFDLDITRFRVSRTIRYRNGGTKAVGITLTVTNEGVLPGSAFAEVTGARSDGVVVYREVLEVTDDVGGRPSAFEFPAYVPEAVGDISWTATLDDGYPDIDEASATTHVR
jgi:hypothetical protein